MSTKSHCYKIVQITKTKRILFDSGTTFLFISGKSRKNLKELTEVFMTHLLFT